MSKVVVVIESNMTLTYINGVLINVNETLEPNVIIDEYVDRGYKVEVLDYSGYVLFEDGLVPELLDDTYSILAAIEAEEEIDNGIIFVEEDIVEEIIDEEIIDEEFFDYTDDDGFGDW